MKFQNKREFASWFDAKTKRYLSGSSWSPPSAYQEIAQSILRGINANIVIPNPFGNGTWKGAYDYGERIWDKNVHYLVGRESQSSSHTSYSSNNSSTNKSSSSYSSQNSYKPDSYNKNTPTYSGGSSSSYSTPSASGSGIAKRQNFDAALRKIQEFSNQIPSIPSIGKFDTDGGLFGLGDHYINGREMNNYVKKVQDIFQKHNEIITKTIREFRDVYETFDYLDKEYLLGIVQTSTKAAKAVEGAKEASKQAKTASEQAKTAADKALKNEEDLKKDVDNLRKVVEKIRTIKDDLNLKIEKTDFSLSQKIETVHSYFSRSLKNLENDISKSLISEDEIVDLRNKIKTINQLEKQISDWEEMLINEVDKLTQEVNTQKNIIENLTSRLEKAEQTTLSETSSQSAQEPASKSQTGLIIAYIIGGLGLVGSICSLLLR